MRELQSRNGQKCHSFVTSRKEARTASRNRQIPLGFPGNCRRIAMSYLMEQGRALKTQGTLGSRLSQEPHFSAHWQHSPHTAARGPPPGRPPDPPKASPSQEVSATTHWATCRALLCMPSNKFSLEFPKFGSRVFCVGYINHVVFSRPRLLLFLFSMQNYFLSF